MTVLLRVMTAFVVIGLAVFAAYEIGVFRPIQPQPAVMCQSDVECEVRGKDEWERCHHVKDAIAPGQQAARDATSHTQNGEACLCVASKCAWAGKEYPHEQTTRANAQN